MHKNISRLTMTDTIDVYTDTLCIFYGAVFTIIQHNVFTCKMKCVSSLFIVYSLLLFKYHHFEQWHHQENIKLIPFHALLFTLIYKFVTYFHSKMHSWHVGFSHLSTLNKSLICLSHRLSLVEYVLEGMCICRHYSSYASGNCIS